MRHTAGTVALTDTSGARDATGIEDAVSRKAGYCIDRERGADPDARRLRGRNIRSRDMCQKIEHMEIQVCSLEKGEITWFYHEQGFQRETLSVHNLNFAS